MFSNYMKSLMGGFIVSILIVGGSNISAQEWSTPIRFSGYVEGWHPQILAERDTVHAIYVNSMYWQARYSRSTDGGESWQDPQVLSDTSQNNAQSPQILKCGTNLIALWRAVISISGHPTKRNIGYDISTDDGLTWLAPAYVLQPNCTIVHKYYASNDGAIINITITSSGSGDDMTMHNVRSTDFGESWSEPVLISQPHTFSGRGDQVSSGNYVYLVWSGSFGGGFPMRPNFMKSTDAGSTWSANEELGECDVYSQHVAISANDKGEVAVLWIGPDNNVNLRLSNDFGDTWEPAVEITSNNSARESCDIRLTGHAILTCWEDYRFNPDLGAIYFKRSLDDGQSWEDEYYVDRNSAHSWDPSLTGYENRHYLIWYDNRGPGGIYFSRWPAEITSVENEDELIPGKVSLFAYPNPFNSSTIISYSGLASGDIGIYDIGGRLVRRLPINHRSGTITWDATSGDGNKISSGIYFVRAVDFDRNYRASIRVLYIK